MAALTKPRLLQSVNHAAGRDRFDVQHIGQSSLIDPGIAMDAHEHTPLRAGTAGVARHFIKPPPHESRNPRKDISNALSHNALIVSMLHKCNSRSNARAYRHSVV